MTNSFEYTMDETVRASSSRKGGGYRDVAVGEPARGAAHARSDGDVHGVAPDGEEEEVLDKGVVHGAGSQKVGRCPGDVLHVRPLYLFASGRHLLEDVDDEGSALHVAAGTGRRRTRDRSHDRPDRVVDGDTDDDAGVVVPSYAHHYLSAADGLLEHFVPRRDGGVLQGADDLVEGLHSAGFGVWRECGTENEERLMCTHTHTHTPHQHTNENPIWNSDRIN